MRKADIISGGLLVALALLVVTGTLELPYWADVAPGPAFAARWVAVIAAALGAGLIWEAMRRRDDTAIEWPDREGTRKVLATSVLLIAFGLGLPVAGFVLSGLGFMMAMLVGVQGRAVMPSALATIITIGGGYGIFIKWLQIKLPMGPLGI